MPKVIPWTKERCKAEALKYETRLDFSKGSRAALIASYKNGWIDDVCEHMTLLRKPSGYWTKERCRKEALKYNTMQDLMENSGAGAAIYGNGWKDELCSHMTKANQWDSVSDLFSPIKRLRVNR